MAPTANRPKAVSLSTLNLHLGKYQIHMPPKELKDKRLKPGQEVAIPDTKIKRHCQNRIHSQEMCAFKLVRLAVRRSHGSNQTVGRGGTQPLAISNEPSKKWVFRPPG